jgi:serine/threonine protein kinase
VTSRPTPFASPSSDGVLAIRTLGDYHLLRKLGQGGMGEIFLAKRVGVGGFEKTVVVKTMLESLASSEEFVAMFFDEAHLAARLSHPNIAQIYDFGVIDGCYYLTMEYIPGEDLASIIGRMYRDEVQIPVAVAARIVIEVCEGLHYAHTLSENGEPLGIVHRDVSPSNVMVSYQGVIKLLDFGIAKAASRVSHTRAGGVKGKLSFLAPELIRGLDVDPRADLFSMGITLYSLLTKQHPFRRDSEIAIAHAITDADAPDPRRLRPDLPDELVAIVAKSLERDRERRFGSAAEMAAALQAFLGKHAEGTGGSQVARFLIDLFGKEAARSKSEIPTLTRLDLAAVVATPTAPRAVFLDDSTPAARMRTPPPVAGTPALAPVRRPWLPAVVMGVIAVPLLVLGFHFAGRRAQPALEPLVRVLPPVAVVPDAGPPVVVAPVAPVVAPAAPKAPSAKTAARAPGPRPPRPTPARLEEKGLKAVVARAQPRLVACFKRHQAELPGETGQVKIELAVAGSGMVTSAGVHLPGFSSAALARCLEDEALRMQFPAHSDKEVRFAFPLLYRRGGD